jgi:hypothetical protein
MEASDVFLNARDVIADGWCRGHRAEDAAGKYRDAEGTYMEGWDPRATSWCLMGAVERVLGHKVNGPLFNFISDRLQERGYDGYIAFNDGPWRTQNEVIGMLDDLARDAKDSHLSV